MGHFDAVDVEFHHWMQCKRDVDRVSVVAAGPPTRVLEMGGGVVLLDLQTNGPGGFPGEYGRVGSDVNDHVDADIVDAQVKIKMIRSYRETMG